MRKCWSRKPHAPHVGTYCIRPFNHNGYHQATINGQIVRWFL